MVPNNRQKIEKIKSLMLFFLDDLFNKRTEAFSCIWVFERNCCPNDQLHKNNGRRSSIIFHLTVKYIANLW